MKNSRKLILIVLLALLLIAAITVAACTPDDPTHQHTFAQEWSSNRSEHWHAATCGHKVTSDRAAHNFGTDDVCDTCGYTKGQGGSDAPTHQHTFAEQWSINDAEHWHAATCNHDVTADNAAHTLVNNVCSVCGYQNNVNWDDFTFERSDDGYILTKYNGTAAHVNIPDTYNDLPVVGIGKGAFYECESLVSVTIPNSVKFIDGNSYEGVGAFAACYNLTAVNFGTNGRLESIGDYAFLACYSLTSITIPDSVTSIGEGAFGDCLHLTSIIIPDSVTSIGEGAFGGCFSAVIYCEAPEQPSGWDSDWNVLYYNTSCCPVIWNYKQNNIADDGYEYEIVDGIRYGFKDSQAKVYGNNYSGDVTIPSTVEYQGKDYTVKSISDGAFVYCLDLTSVAIPDGITDIGGYSFSVCISLTSVTIPNSVKTIGEDAFEGCENLQSIYYNGSIADWCGVDSVDSVVHDTDNFYIKENDSWQKLTDIADLEIPDGVTKIGDCAFCGCNLTSITIPDSVTSIGNDAFANCDNLTTVNFRANSKLESIGDWAFQDCSSLTSITIPDSVTSIGSMAFRFCENLVTVNFGANSKLESLVEEVFAESGLTSITIPASVTSIGDWAFGRCENLATVNFGANSELKSIGDNAFSECDNLVTVDFGQNSKLESIGDETFSECRSLKSIILPGSVTSIGDGAFVDCENLATVNIGANSKLESIGDGAFDDCYSLTSIFIPQSVTKIGKQVFYNCDNLTIYCEAETKPSGWSSDWNRSGYSSSCRVVWGATRQDAEQR